MPFRFKATDAAGRQRMVAQTMTVLQQQDAFAVEVFVTIVVWIDQPGGFTAGETKVAHSAGSSAPEWRR